MTRAFPPYLTNMRATVLFLFAFAACLNAETGHDAWLRYTPRPGVVTPAAITTTVDSPVINTARDELIRGIRGITGRTLRIEPNLPDQSAIILETVGNETQTPDGYLLRTVPRKNYRDVVISAVNDRGVLYGAFALLRKIQLGQSIASLNDRESPRAPVRWVNQWDNLDGAIERGYGGRSIFWEDGHARSDLTRVGEYGRLLASIGINGCAINNVNADRRILFQDFLPQIARIAAALRPWGVHVVLSVDFASPQSIGVLSTFDPLDPAVATWWQTKANELYTAVPDLAGLLIKADSEGRAGPSAYHRTHADAANVVARALKPHGGLVFYRGFVYDHHMDWRNPKNDRARAAYDNFHALDGQFDDNAVLQIKNGPIDFQVREPVSPLFAGLRRTNEAIELQITQEYTGQQRHLCFLPSMWKEVLDFDQHAGGGSTPVKDLVAGRTFHRPIGGFVGVANVGMDTNWLGHPLAMADLYGFGRLAWNPNVSARDIAEEWTTLTFGSDPTVVRTITAMLLASWSIYESYTGPLGAGTLTDILGSHYGPGIESSERNGWGQWHRADHEGIGMDRSAATGTGFVAQYPAPAAKLYESAETTPDELLLFFHHVPYTYRLHSGKSLIQHIYDSHYQGAAQAEDLVRQWSSLKGRIDDERYQAVLSRLEYQAGHATVWRDAVCNWFLRISGIPDTQARVGHHSDRIEAEAMRLQGYTPINVTPEENASGGKAIVCEGQAQPCQATFHFDRPAGWYDLDVQYFDQNNGESKFRVFIGEQQVDEWIANDHLPATKPGGDSSTRRRIIGLALRPGDEIRIEGITDGAEKAPLDYIEIHAR